MRWQGWLFHYLPMATLGPRHFLYGSLCLGPAALNAEETEGWRRGGGKQCANVEVCKLPIHNFQYQ